MDREQAISLLKEVISSCSITVYSLNLVSLGNDKYSSKGYQLQLKSAVDEVDRKTIQRIVKGRNHTLKEINETFIIY